MHSDRVAFALQMTGAAPIHGYQIPSFTDPLMFMNGSAGFALFDPQGEHLYEFLSPQTQQQLVFTPALAFVMFSASCDCDVLDGDARASSPIFFSFAKPFADGTAVHASLGVQTVNRSSLPPPPRPPSSYQSISISLLMQSSSTASHTPSPAPTGSPQLNLTLPASLSHLLDATHTFVSVHNQFMGWIFGNNPASVPCLQEMAFFSWIQAMFDVGNIERGVAGVVKEVVFFEECGWNDGGGSARACTSPAQPGPATLMERWAASGFYNAPWGPMQDQTPNYILAVHSLACSTGDALWLRQRLPSLTHIASFMLQNGVDDTGIFIMPNSSGLPDGGKHCTNWFDIVEFGHFDGYTNALAIAAFGALAEIHSFLGESQRAAYYNGVQESMIVAFNSHLWRQDLRRYIDWIDISGGAREYGFVDVDFLAIIGAAANSSQAAAFVELLDERYAELAQEFKLNDTAIWSVPCSLYPLHTSSANNDAAIPLAPFPSYENGGSFFRQVGYEALARALSGNASGGHATYERFMTFGFAQNRGWAQQLYWNTGELVGADPLNNALMAVWGWLRAVFGVKPTLAGVVSTHAPAPEVEGGQWTFAFLGKNFCVQVLSGVAVECGSAAAIPSQLRN